LEEYVQHLMFGEIIVVNGFGYSMFWMHRMVSLVCWVVMRRAVPVLGIITRGDI